MVSDFIVDIYLGFSASEALGIRVLYMSFDKFLLAVESRDLSEADKIVIRVSPFPKLIDG